MAFHILPQGPPTFGESLGSGLGSGLAALAQLKLNQVAARQQQNTFSQALQGIGITPEVAQFVAAQSPQNQGLVLQNLPALMQLGGAKPQRAAQPQMLGGNNAQQASMSEAPSGGGAQAAPSAALQSLLQGKTGADLITNPLTSDAVRNALSRLNLGEQVGKQFPGVQAEEKPDLREAMQQAQQLQPQQASTLRPQAAGAGAAPQQPTSPAVAADILSDVFTSPAQKIALRRLEAQQQKEASREARVEQHKIDKETLPTYKAIVAEEEAAKHSDKRIRRMEELVKEGGLPIAALYKGLSDLEKIKPEYGAGAGAIIGGVLGKAPGAAIGATIGAVTQPVASLLKYVQRKTSPNTEEYEKLEADFIKGIKNIFGSRITNLDLESFLKTIPSLSVSDAGKLKIIENIKNFNEAAHIRYKSMEDIIKENGGDRPKNLDLLVNERSKPLLDEAADKFISGVKSYQKEEAAEKQISNFNKAARRSLLASAL